MEELKTFMHDFGLTWGTVFEKRPDLDLPEGTDADAVDAILSLFTALLVRFARRCGKQPRVHWPGANIILKDPLLTKKGKLVRVNQWCWQLDHGSLLCWRLVLRPYVIQRYNPDLQTSGWAREFDRSWSGTSIVEPPLPIDANPPSWRHFLFNIAACTSLLATGSVLKAVGALDVGHDAEELLATVATAVAKAKQPMHGPFGRACIFDVVS
jgi:hypothetical protein